MKHRLYNLSLLLVFSMVAVAQTNTYKDVSTHFDGLGTPYGGCGVPEGVLECPYFVALNVYDTPGEYSTFWRRPLSGGDLQKMGEYKNGENCGRWVNVTVDSYCQGGINDGVPGHSVCQGGSWVDDKFTGASLNMIVADACGDGVVWCRDRKYHLDLSTNSLSEFTKNGVKVGAMLPDFFHNRMISWKYIKAPNYEGDIKIHWLKGAKQYWPCLMITHLENGVVGVEQKVNGNWIPAERNSDMGQSFILKDQNPPFIIRVIDVDKQYVKGGREYTIAIPEECKNGCTSDALETTYTTADAPTLLDKQVVELGHLWLVSAKSELIFQYSANSSQNTLSIYDLTGQLLDSKEVNGDDGLIRMNDLKSGFYIVTLSNNQGVVAHVKICI